MNAQLLNLEGILGGGITKYPVANETGEHPTDAKAGVAEQAKEIAAPGEDELPPGFDGKARAAKKAGLTGKGSG
jgi:hypothetical protein